MCMSPTRKHNVHTMFARCRSRGGELPSSKELCQLLAVSQRHKSDAPQGDATQALRKHAHPYQYIAPTQTSWKLEGSLSLVKNPPLVQGPGNHTIDTSKQKKVAGYDAYKTNKTMKGYKFSTLGKTDKRHTMTDISKEST